MSDNLVLDILHAISDDMAEIKADIRDIKHRMTALHYSVIALAETRENHHATLCSRMDRMIIRLDGVGNRLGQPDGGHGQWRY